MEGFTITHNVCGKEATASYSITTDWGWNSDEEDEFPYDAYTLMVECKHCNESVEIDAKRY